MYVSYFGATVFCKIRKILITTLPKNKNAEANHLYMAGKFAKHLPTH